MGQLTRLNNNEARSGLSSVDVEAFAGEETRVCVGEIFNLQPEQMLTNVWGTCGCLDAETKIDPDVVVLRL